MVCRSPTDRKNASVGLKSEWSWNEKNLRLTFLSSIEIFLFLDLDFQNLATLGFENCPISENENFSLGKKSSPSIFSIPGHSLSSPTEHIFSFLIFFSTFSPYFTVILLVLYAEKPTKLKKAICSFHFLFISNAQIFSLQFENISKMVHSGLKMGPRTL